MSAMRATSRGSGGSGVSMQHVESLCSDTRPLHIAIDLPNTIAVQEQVKCGGNSVTFLHVAMGIVERLEREGVADSDELRFLRECLNAGQDVTHLPCGWVIALDESYDSRQSIIRGYSRKGSLFPEEKKERKDYMLRGTLRAVRKQAEEIELRSSLLEGPSSPSAAFEKTITDVFDKGLPWMGPPVPQWPTNRLSDSVAVQLEETFRSSFADWRFDPFKIAKLTGGRPLQFIGWEALRLSRGFSEFNLDPEKACKFLVSAESMYMVEKTNPYHNNIHAADVTQTVHAMLAGLGVRAFFDPMDTMVMILGAIIHDLGHDGKNNAFHISVRDDLALTYNDRSVLENYHVSQSFKLLIDKPSTNILQGLTRDQLSVARRELIDMVLSTDMTHHFARVGDFGKLVASLGQDPEVWAVDDGAMDVLRALVLHSADISNPTKPFELCRRWSHRCLQEFFLQGDAERRLGLPVSPMRSRTSTNVPGSQLGFIQFMVQPTFGSLVELLPKAQVCLFELRMNQSFWAESQLNNSTGEPYELEFEEMHDYEDVSSEFTCPAGYALESTKLPTNGVDKLTNNPADGMFRKDLDIKKLCVDGESAVTLDTTTPSSTLAVEGFWMPFCACSPSGGSRKPGQREGAAQPLAPMAPLRSRDSAGIGAPFALKPLSPSFPASLQVESAPQVSAQKSSRCMRTCL